MTRRTTDKVLRSAGRWVAAVFLATVAGVFAASAQAQAYDYCGNVLHINYACDGDDVVAGIGSETGVPQPADDAATVPNIDGPTVDLGPIPGNWVSAGDQPSAGLTSSRSLAEAEADASPRFLGLYREALTNQRAAATAAGTRAAPADKFGVCNGCSCDLRVGTPYLIRGGLPVRANDQQVCYGDVPRQTITMCVEYYYRGGWRPIDCGAKSKIGIGAIDFRYDVDCPESHGRAQSYTVRSNSFGSVQNRYGGGVSPVFTSLAGTVYC